MDYAAKMRRHLDQAEVLNEKIDKWDAWAEQEVLANHNVGLDAFPVEHGLRKGEVIRRMKELLKNYPLYGNRVGQRNHHIQFAQVYALATQVQLQQEQHQGQRHPRGWSVPT